MSGSIPFVYLTSPPFSGSTLFSFLVNSHPAIATVGEMTGPVLSQDPATYRCSCGERIRQCPFWRQVAAQMTSRGFAFDPGNFDTRIRLGDSPFSRLLLSGSLRSPTFEAVRDTVIGLWPSQRRRLRHLVDRNKALAASILQVTRKTLLVDASKTPTTIRHLAADPDLDLRVVHLVRDVRGASDSRRKNQGETDWRRAIKSWVRMNRHIERQLQRLPADRWIRIRYEDLSRTPAESLDRFYRFCGLEPHGIAADFGAFTHHIVGNRMRLGKINQTRLDEGWRRSLNSDELACADQLAGEMHVRYGYPRMDVSDLEHSRARQE